MDRNKAFKGRGAKNEWLSKIDKAQNELIARNAFNEYGKIPPQDTEIEKAYLGALMLENTHQCKESMRKLRAEDFYKDEHQLIYRAIQETVRAGKMVDILVVASRLKNSGSLNSAGGPFYLTQLTGRVGTAANVDVWAKIIKEKSIKRTQIIMAHKLIAEAYDDSADCFESTQNAIKRLYESEPSSDIKWINGNSVKTSESDIVHFMEKPFVSSGNIATIIAPPGTGKSNVCDVICSAAVRDDIDTLGFDVNPYGKKVLYLDTERSHNDSIKGWSRMQQRVGETHHRRLEERVNMGRLKEASIDERVMTLENLVASGEYKLIVLDMVTDFVNNDNDMEETGEFVTLLTRLASKYDVGIIATIHDNPTNGKEKATGVIGSRLMKKSETVAFLSREADNKRIVALTTDFAYGKARNTDFVGRTIHMQWDNALAGFGTTQYDPKEKDKEATKEKREINQKVWDAVRGIIEVKGDKDGILPIELQKELGLVLGITTRNAGFRVADMAKAGRIVYVKDKYKLARWDKPVIGKEDDEEDEF